jgi:hypothetical protein
MLPKLSRKCIDKGTIHMLKYIMIDVSITASKVRGRPKGRPSSGVRNDTLNYPEPMYNYNKYLYKLALWEANALNKNLKYSD